MERRAPVVEVVAVEVAVGATTHTHTHTDTHAHTHRHTHSRTHIADDRDLQSTQWLSPLDIHTHADGTELLPSYRGD